MRERERVRLGGRAQPVEPHPDQAPVVRAGRLPARRQVVQDALAHLLGAGDEGRVGLGGGEPFAQQRAIDRPERRQVRLRLGDRQEALDARLLVGRRCRELVGARATASPGLCRRPRRPSLAGVEPSTSTSRRRRRSASVRTARVSSSTPAVERDLLTGERVELALGRRLGGRLDRAGRRVDRRSSTRWPPARRCVIRRVPASSTLSSDRQARSASSTVAARVRHVAAQLEAVALASCARTRTRRSRSRRTRTARRAPSATRRSGCRGGSLACGCSPHGSPQSTPLRSRRSRDERDDVDLLRAAHEDVVAAALDRVAGADADLARVARVARHVEAAHDAGAEHVAVGEPALGDRVVDRRLQVVLGQQHAAEEPRAHEALARHRPVAAVASAAPAAAAAVMRHRGAADATAECRRNHIRSSWPRLSVHEDPRDELAALGAVAR